MHFLILTQGASFSPIELFMQADWVVKAVIIGLALASIWAWTIIVSFMLKIGRINRDSDKFEREFWASSDIDGFFGAHGKSDLPVAKVFSAGVAEWRRSTNGKSIDRAGTRERLATAMDATIAAETDKLANRLNFLATTGSVAPFVGLFGTVSCAALQRLPPSRIRHWPWSRPALPKRCSRPPSACLPLFPPLSPTTAFRTG
jgi:biopolymer transport protein TolQ